MLVPSGIWLLPNGNRLHRIGIPKQPIAIPVHRNDDSVHGIGKSLHQIGKPEQPIGIPVHRIANLVQPRGLRCTRMPIRCSREASRASERVFETRRVRKGCY